MVSAMRSTRVRRCASGTSRVFAFVVRRLIGMVVVLFAITILTFLIFFATPGIDPSRQLAGRNPDPATVAAVRHQFGLDRPLPIRYALMMKRLFITRDLVSYGNQALNVVPAIQAAAPVTTEQRQRPHGVDRAALEHLVRRDQNSAGR